MAVPDARVELQIGGDWVDVTDDVLHDRTIRYSWGRRAEGSVRDPSAASFTLRNPTGLYSGRNPNSPNHGLLNRNTPVRLSHGGASRALVLTNGVAGGATTPDTAALDITGDIDVRADVTPGAWGGVTSTSNWEIAGKYDTTGNQRSWLLIQFRWSANGSALNIYTSSVPVPWAPGERGAVRATLDVDNGSGGFTVTFYTAPTMSGSWTQLGDATVTTAGTTSIFSSTAVLEVGDIAILGFANISREIHAIEVRSGIGGSAVAAPDFSVQAEGASGFTDAVGRTWTVANAEITSRRNRVLEASEWSPRWGASGHDVTVPVQAAGILRRLGQGAKALSSTLRRRLPSRGPVAYWPLEDGSEATQAYSPVPGCPPLRVADFSFAADDSCPGSAALPSIGAAATMHAAIPPYFSATSGYLVAMLYSIDSMPASKSGWLSIQTTGTGSGIVMSFSSSAVICDVYDGSGTLLTSQSFSNSSVFGPGRWFRFDLTAQAAGLDVDYHLGFVDVEGAGVQWNWTESGAAPGIVTDIDTGFGPLLSGMRVGHLGVYPSSDVSVWGASDNGYRGESATARLLRLSTEESLPLRIASNNGTPTRLGPQRPSTLLDLLGEIEEADDGILSEDPQRPGLLYRTRDTLYSQNPRATIPYGQLAPPLEPTDDDRLLRNDRTVSRVGGSSGRAVLETGALSVQPPPAGVGIYDDSRTLNVYADAQVQPLADWLLHRGTWDESRYPRVRILLHKYPELIPTVSGLRPGDVIRITDTPVWLPPGPIDLMVEGAEEEMKTFEWTITLSCSPAGPWTVAVADDAARGRQETSGAVLGAAATDSATTLVVYSTQTEVPRTLPLWTQDPADYPMVLDLGGESVTASAATSLAEDNFNRTVAAGGWGTASDGHTYTLTGGTNSERSVASNRGVVTVSASQTAHRQQTVSETPTDAEVRCQMAVSATATGGSLLSSILLRWTAASTQYRARVEFTTGGAVNVMVTVGTTLIGTSASTGLTYSPGDVFDVRVRIIGYRVLMRVWPAGTTEPILWHIDRTDVSSTHASGEVGLSAQGATGNSNVGVEFRFDNLVVESPQRVTVSRSTNAVTKAHAAGTAVSLAQPAIAAL
jgi:hypothetical protein